MPSRRKAGTGRAVYPTTGQAPITRVSVEVWQQLSEDERRTRASAWHRYVDTHSASVDGRVVVEFNRPLAAKDRGRILLDLETRLRDRVAPHLVVWHVPLGDRNSLRVLRGIEVKQ